MGDLLQGHIAAVTGGGSGIGRAIAKGFAAEGGAIAVLELNMDGAAETVADIEAAGGTAQAFAFDVTDPDACHAVAGAVEAALGEVSVLVNSAGIARRNHVTSDQIAEDWKAVIDVNLNGVFNATHGFLEQLRRTKGRIVNLGSIQSFVHTFNSVAYTASKGGVLNLTRSLAAELGPDGVRVNAIGPGLIETPLNEEARRTKPEMVPTFLRHTPLGRSGQPQDIVGPALFLASDMSAYVTGTILMVDGGYLTI
ncbi:MAG: glucose 1-dehydrogenase [Alphaproteobacteria bacterium]|nr:glucose 1-dehydrogenase [Alphaproteobacteria bacterium]